MKENKFFAVFGAIMAIGILGLGFFVFKGWSRGKELSDEYAQTSGRVLSLKKKKLFPNSANLELKKEQVADYVAKADALRDKLLASQRELKDISQQDFPNILLSTYGKTADYAKSRDIALPENFYFGMEIYKDGLPPQKAVSLLEWQLDALNTFTNILLETGVSSIDELTRALTPVESRDSEDEKKPAGRAGTGSGSAQPGNGDAVPYNPDAVLDAYRFEVTFTGSHDSFVDALNRISNDPSFFYWVRYLRVENENKQGPFRNEVFVPKPAPELQGEPLPEPEAAAPAPEPAPAPAPAPEAVPGDAATPDSATLPADTESAAPAAIDPPAPAPDVAAANVEPAMIDVREIFGTESVKAHLVVDLIRFKKPENAGEAGAGSN